jgi:hypothetical protein
MEDNALPTAEHPRLALLDDWLDVMESNNGGAPSYCHLLIRQKKDVESAVWDELFVYIDHAHAGARQALRAPLEDSLHPLQHDTEVDPAFGYPHKLGDTALKGFFGEIIAGIVAEYYTGDGEHEWEVPVYLFRTHVVAFQQLEVMKQTNDWERQIVGRTGDDGIAFARDENDRIVAWLACEAKCTGNHSSTLISDNHVKLSQAVTRPVDLLRLIDALKDYRDDDYSRNWIAALRRYWWDNSRNPSISRCDFSMYVCGACPKKNRTWIPTNAPHRDYTGRRSLTCAELHMTGVDEIIRSLYERMDSTS